MTRKTVALYMLLMIREGSLSLNWTEIWYNQPRGAKNWSFTTIEEALDHFYQKRYLPRVKHGYQLVIGNILEDWPSTVA